jgi:hypothetical protein
MEKFSKFFNLNLYPKDFAKIPEFKKKNNKDKEKKHK